MIHDVWRKKLEEYNLQNTIEQENTLQEILQLYVLSCLAQTGFFQKAEFHGGTCLRLIHGMHRFSEDLDFVLKGSDPSFSWKHLLDKLKKNLTLEGLTVTAQDKSKAESNVRKAFLTFQLISEPSRIELPFPRDPRKKLRIKLEVDCNPPSGSEYETHYLNFPYTTAITAQTLASSFAGKIHALLCRSYTKGRDWYDFVWYASKKTRPNFTLLQNAIHQDGPWQDEKPTVDTSWVLDAFRTVIAEIDWQEAKEDVRRFLPLREQESLDLWDSSFFEYHRQQLGQWL